MSRALKMMKDSKDVIDSISCTPKFIDLVFLKVKSKTEKKIDYHRFLDFLFIIACMKILSLDISDRYSDEWVLSKTEFYEEGIDSFNLLEHQAFRIKFHKYGRLRGKAALITEFVLQRLSFSADYKRISKGLQTRCNDSISEKAVNKAAYVIIRFFTRCLQFHRWHGE